MTGETHLSAPHWGKPAPTAKKLWASGLLGNSPRLPPPFSGAHSFTETLSFKRTKSLILGSIFAIFTVFLLLVFVIQVVS